MLTENTLHPTIYKKCSKCRPSAHTQAQRYHLHSSVASSFYTVVKQESLANAKVNARQHCVSLSCLCKIFTLLHNMGLSAFKFLWWAQTHEVTRNSERIRPYSSSRSSKVIDLGVNRKPICDFLLVINSNFSRIWYRFRDIDA